MLTHEEAQMDFSGIPIYMEHDEKMKVGEASAVELNNPDGSKWIVGQAGRREHIGFVCAQCSARIVERRDALLHRS